MLNVTWTKDLVADGVGVVVEARASLGSERECKLPRGEDPLWAHTSEAGPRTRIVKTIGGMRCTTYDRPPSLSLRAVWRSFLGWTLPPYRPPQPALRRV